MVEHGADLSLPSDPETKTVELYEQPQEAEEDDQDEEGAGAATP